MPMRGKPEHSFISTEIRGFLEEVFYSNTEFAAVETKDSTFTHLSSMKIEVENIKSKRTSPALTKFFGHVRSRKMASSETVEDDDRWHEQVDLSKLLLGPKLGEGTHGKIYRGNYNDESVAVKVSKVPDDPDCDGKRDLHGTVEKKFNQESALLLRLHHPNVLKFVGVWRQPPVFGIITEYLSGGSLRSYLNKIEHQHKSVPLPTVVSMALDIARGMAYIHSQGIVHRDLKPDNVLISEDFHLKIADFGDACEEAHCHLLADRTGTLRWMAPEMMKQKKSYNRKIDVYSFGLMLCEMIAGTIPFEGMAPEAVVFGVLNKDLRPTVPQRCPPAMRELIVQCWSSNPGKRPEFWQIVKVLEKFETSLASEGSLNNLVLNLTSQHDKKRLLLHWIQKLDPIRHSDKLINTAYNRRPIMVS
nr:serine/threonine-protein kinase HT1-like [Coffea arabica]